MAIKLRAIEDTAEVTKLIRGSVAHLGRSVPEGKQGLSLQGRHISDHHGKIFYAYDSYRYVNLTSRPTQIFRGSTFSFQLDPFMPQCEVLVGDRLKLGSVIVEIKRLVPPTVSNPPRPWAVGKKLVCSYLRCRGDACFKAIEVVHTISDLANRLRDYTNPHEILRAAAEWLAQLWSPGNKRGCRLSLGLPESIVIAPRPGQPPGWQDADVAVVRRIGRRHAVTSIATLDSLPVEMFDRGLAFHLEDKVGKTVGLGAGICEELAYDGDPRAGHFVFVQYSTARAPTEDDLCILNHAATHISELLYGIQAAGLRRARELERKGGVESQRLFHDMESDIAAARSYLTRVPKGRRPNITGALVALKKLDQYVNHGLQALEAGQGFHYGWADLRQLCERVLDDEFDNSNALRQTRHWRIRVLGNAGKLRRVPCDPFGIERVLRNFVRNARNAVDKRGANPLVKRIHLLLDCPRIGGLDYVRVRVLDDGVGLPPEATATIFEGRFSTTSGGHGLGTQVVAEQIRRHRGLLLVASEPGKGTVAGFLLPAPAPKTVESLDDPSRWIGPYQARAENRPFIERRPLEQVLATDNVVRAWFHKQGAVQWPKS